MFRVVKALNHNSVLVINMDTNKEYIFLGKGIGFGKKVNERMKAPENADIYFLQNETEKSYTQDIVKNIKPQVLEIASKIIIETEKKFKKVDKNILCSLTDYIEFAIKRIKNKEQISNISTADIKALFPEEYEVAKKGKEIIEKVEGVEINEDEIGYIALHIHSCLGSRNVSQSIETAVLVGNCITLIEQNIGRKIDIESLSYNCLMSHIKYIVARALKEEIIEFNVNYYIMRKFPKSFKIAQYICEKLGSQLDKKIPAVEIGYLAIHVEGVCTDELNNTK